MTKDGNYLEQIVLAKYRIKNKSKPLKQSPEVVWNLVNINISLSKLDLLIQSDMIQTWLCCFNTCSFSTFTKGRG